MRQYLALLLTAGFGLVVAVAMLLLSVLFGPSKKTPIKQEPFECGMPPAMESRGAARVNFYLVAILFVMFDIEIVFLYPWAVSFRQLDPNAFYAMGAFLAVLFAGLVYAVKKGALEWD
ncbi:MAG: NADH-quinone oxidoreductase subunit A [Elusimicrobiota bacterium]|nr:NADH-quinone oxidoreductase subunit A [Elusimicrobiota bacterium]